MGGGDKSHEITTVLPVVVCEIEEKRVMRLRLYYYAMVVVYAMVHGGSLVVVIPLVVVVYSCYYKYINIVPTTAVSIIV